MKKNQAKKLALAYDLGGTKVLAGIVHSSGKVLSKQREFIDLTRGKKSLVDQLGRIGRGLLKEFPGVRGGTLATAGPLDPSRGLWLDPTNMFKSGAKKSFGVVPISSELSRAVGIPVSLENDAAAAAVAEHWLGKAKGFDNAIVLTLGTGLGVGVIANGSLVRAGRGLHPEGGHMVVRAGDPTAQCACGNSGCAEAFLSGRHFTRRFNDRHGTKFDAEEIAARARKGNQQAQQAFSEYASLLASTLSSFAVLYAPEIVVFTGSFSATSDLFISETRKNLAPLLKRRRKGVDFMPKLAVSSLNNEAGLLGAGMIALQTIHSY